jgi:hypothetical protein
LGWISAKSAFVFLFEDQGEGDGIVLAAKDKTAHAASESGSREEIMCIVCESELWGEHRALETEFFKPCKKCKKFPGGSSEGTCYHCYAVGNTIDEAPSAPANRVVKNS